MTDLSRLSLNQKTINHWSAKQAIAGCVDAGLGWIGLWREPVAELGIAQTTQLLQQTEVKVSSLCRGGFFPTVDDAERRRRAADNRVAVDEAVALGTDVLILVCGGIADGDLDGSRQQVVAGIAELAPYAADRGIRLGIEPLHPMYCADRSVIVTLAQALDVAERFPTSQVGVVIDTFHLWWDPEVWTQIERAGSRIVSYQVCDWLDPLPDVLLGRGMPGDGPIDFARFSQAVTEAGYTGPIEVEIFNTDIWARDGGEVIAEMTSRYAELIA